MSAFFKVLIATYTNKSYLSFYVRSAMGNLGWADWPQAQFSAVIYYFLGLSLVAIGFFSTSIEQLRRIKWIRITLFSCALASILIVSFSLLVAWTTHPARYIEGIQGRYFHFPLLFIGYSLVSLNKVSMTKKSKLANALLILYVVFTFLITGSVVLARFY